MRENYQRHPVTFNATVHSDPKAEIQTTHTVSADLPCLLGEHELGSSGSSSRVMIALLEKPPRLVISGGIIGNSSVEVHLPDVERIKASGRDVDMSERVTATGGDATRILTVVFSRSELNGGNGKNEL